MRALALQPKILLLDEPLGALDPIIRAELQQDLKAIFAEVNQTVVLVTHDMGEAAFLADTIVLMREGHIVQQGTLKEFQESPREPFVTQFLNAQRAVVAL
jgi:osmoprotectant transport system ATP-binding protein